MFKDKYLENCKKLYAVRAGEIIGSNYDDDYLEYAHQQFEKSDVNKILLLLSKEIKKELLDRKKEKDEKSNEQVGKKLRSFRITKDHEEERRLEILKNLTSRKNFPRMWAKKLVEIFEEFPETYGPYQLLQNKILNQAINKKIEKTIFQETLEALSKVFNLSEKEQAIITFLYLDRTDEQVDEYFSGRTMDITNVTKNLKYFCRFFDVRPGELKDILSKDSILIKAGIIKKARRDDSLELSETIVGFLSGISKDSIVDDYVKEASLGDSLSIIDHNVNSEKRHTLLNLLNTKGGCNIILYGHPGTGKTEFAKSLAKETGKKIYFINQSDTDGEESISFRKQAIIAAHNIIQNEDAIIAVDECDKILNIFDGMWKCDKDDTNDRKAWINAFLENAKHKIIWISNRVDGIDDSTKRRFSYSLEFQPLSFMQRKKVWENQITKQGATFIDDAEILNLAKSLKVNSGGITLALKDVKGMKNLETKEQKLAILKTILAQHQGFTSGVELGMIKKTSLYNLDIVNSDYPLEKLLEYSNQFLNEKALFHAKGVFNLNLLLQGPPGTGKTEFVKHMAETMDRELVVKRASDIQSKWVGESVKNIARSFKEAQDNGHVLFFDEADSFFGSREGANDYTAENTNEFLTQMENFQGLLICATNFTQRLDQAAMRRFNYKVKFDYLTNPAKIKMFETYLSNLCIDWEENSVGERLGKIQGLTPGDFKVVHQKNVFNEKKLASAILNELVMEVSYKKGTGNKVGLN